MSGPDPRDGDCGNDVAAYALGALEPNEASAFEEHLETCVVCRDELESFVHVVDALPMAAPQYRPSRALRRRVMKDVHATARPSPARAPGSLRGRLGAIALPRPALAGALTVLIALVAFGALELGGGSGGGGGSRVIQASVGDAQVRVQGDRGALVIEHRPGCGTAASMSCGSSEGRVPRRRARCSRSRHGVRPMSACQGAFAESSACS